MIPKSGNRFSERNHASPGNAARVLIAKIGAAHGVRGELRLWPFTQDPMSVARYGALQSKDGTRFFEIAQMRAAKDHLVARFKGIDDRNAAEALNGIELYVPRERLPPPDEGEYYHADLIGLDAVTAEGAPFGRVIAVHNFGAGDILEIAPETHGPTLMLPFTDAVVPTVDIAERRLTVVPPTEIEGDTPDAKN